MHCHILSFVRICWCSEEIISDNKGASVHFLKQMHWSEGNRTGSNQIAMVPRTCDPLPPRPAVWSCLGVDFARCTWFSLHILDFLYISGCFDRRGERRWGKRCFRKARLKWSKKPPDEGVHGSTSMLNWNSIKPPPPPPRAFCLAGTVEERGNLTKNWMTPRPFKKPLKT